MTTNPSAQHRPPIIEYSWLLGILVVLCACQPITKGNVAATHTAQAQQARQLATQIAFQLKETSAVRATHANATGQALDAMATTAAALNSATQSAIAIQSTAMVEELQRQMSAALSWPVVLTDTFTENANGWPSGEAADEYGISRWSFQEGKFVWEAEAKQGFVWWAVPNAPETTDFYLDLTAQQLEGPDDSAYGVILRLTDEVNYLALEINQDGYYGLFQHSREGWTTIIPWAYDSAIVGNQPNQISILALDDQFSIVLNSKFITNYSNEAFKHGQNGILVGLFKENDQARWEFSNFILRAPAGSLVEYTPTPANLLTPNPTFTPTP